MKPETKEKIKGVYGWLMRRGEAATRNLERHYGDGTSPFKTYDKERKKQTKEAKNIMVSDLKDFDVIVAVRRRKEE